MEILWWVTYLCAERPRGVQADLNQALRDQLDMVKRELADSKDREKRLLGLLETRLLTDQQPVKLKAGKKGKKGKRGKKK
jgi:hypothetical protein